MDSEPSITGDIVDVKVKQLCRLLIMLSVACSIYVIALGRIKRNLQYDLFTILDSGGVPMSEPIAKLWLLVSSIGADIFKLETASGLAGLTLLIVARRYSKTWAALWVPALLLNIYALVWSFTWVM